MMAIGWFFPFAFYALAAANDWSLLKPLPAVIGVVAVSIAFGAYFRSELHRLESGVQDLDFEIDLEQVEVLSHERRAEKIVRINNLQLRRYYDLNIGQNVWVFGLGLTCIVLGIAIVGAAFYLVLWVAQDQESQLIIAVMGSVSSILINFVAAIFLRMHSGASASLGDFHSRLVETNQLLMGNLLASRIGDDETRWKTLAELALQVARGRPPRDADG